MNLPSIFAAAAPYPKIEDFHPDPVAVREIKKNYCSQKSETTAILQYVYSHFVSVPFAKEIANVFLQIGKVEMHHLDLLAEAMVGFGGDPQFVDPYGVSLNGRWVVYSKTLKRMLQTNLEAEIEAAHQYRKSAQTVSNYSLRRLFLRLAEDEDLHAEILRTMLGQQEFWKND